jgi:hypothetical protein
LKITRTAKRYQIHLGKREKRVLMELLKLYPRIPPGYSRLSQSAAGHDAQVNQQLLEAALAEQRRENQRQLRTLLAGADQYADDETGCRLSLPAGDVEWLLQVLNDIRVGSWIILGSPDQIHELALLNEKTAPDFWAMEMSGLFQQRLIEALAALGP